MATAHATCCALPRANLQNLAREVTSGVFEEKIALKAQQVCLYFRLHCSHLWRR